MGLRDLEKRFTVPYSTAQRICRCEGFKSYHVSKHPYRTLKQNLAAKRHARMLYEPVLTKYNECILMDDETNIKMGFQLPGQMFYRAKRKARPQKDSNLSMQARLPAN